MKHPTDEQLAAFIDRRLSQAESNAVIEHLASCQYCYRTVANTVRTMLEISASLPDPDPEPPAPMIERRAIGKILLLAGLIALYLFVASR